MKKIIVLVLSVLTVACSSRPDEKYACPEIVILQDTARKFQSEMTDKFQINVVGFESYCYQNDADKRYYAVITPTFQVRRLEDSTTTNVDADYYVKTSFNEKDYIGRRVFRQTLNIPRDVKEQTIKGKTSINRISNPPYRDFKIYLGLDLSDKQVKKSKKMFDIKYRYLSEDEIEAQNDPIIENVSLEILPDEEVIYSDKLQRPIVVKKNRPKNNCQN